jgi:CheY-like chemotaxis protein
VLDEGRLREQARAPIQAGLPETVAPIRVLVADDNDDSRYVMGSILRLNPGATVVAEASDGQAAIGCVRDVHPDVVLIDRVMPVMDGLEATRRIKQEWPDLKVLVVTSQYGYESRLAALAAGADGFLDKWDITTDLVPTILRLARGSHRL